MFDKPKPAPAGGIFGPSPKGNIAKSGVGLFGSDGAKDLTVFGPGNEKSEPQDLQ